MVHSGILCHDEPIQLEDSHRQLQVLDLPGWTHTDANSYTNSDGYGYANGNRYGYTNTSGHTYTYSGGNTHADPHSYSCT